MGSQKMLMPLVQNRRGFDLREYNKSLIPRNLYTAIRNLAVVAWITLPWVSYLLAYAVLLFGSDHYRPIGNKQMPSSAWQSTNHGAAELWELQEIYVMVTRVSWWNKHISPRATYGTAECQTYSDEEFCVCSINCVQGDIFMWLKIFQQW